MADEARPKPSNEDIHNRFSFHPAVTEDRDRSDEHAYVREQLEQVALRLVERTPAGREQSLMLTALEEAMFWANAGIARR